VIEIDAWQQVFFELAASIHLTVLWHASNLGLGSAILGAGATQKSMMISSVLFHFSCCRVCLFSLRQLFLERCMVNGQTRLHSLAVHVPTAFAKLFFCVSL
jgi:hypothetical protein